MKKLVTVFSNEKSKYYFLIVMIGLLVTSALFMSEMFVGHDGIYHITRSIGTEIALFEGQFPPLVTSNFVNGFGYSWNLFYPPLTTYFTQIISTFTNSHTEALNLLIIISVILSGITMFKLTKEITNKKEIAFLSSIFYMIAPYRITDIFIRMALGEIVSFIFIPLVFLGLYNLFYKDGKKHFYLTIGAVGLVLTHNISTLLTVVTCILFVLFNIKKLGNKEVIKKLLINCGFILLMIVFFYLPLLEAKMSTDYAVFYDGKMGDAESVYSHTVHLYQLLFGPMQQGLSEPLTSASNLSSDMGINIGLFLVIPLLFTPFVYKKIKKDKRPLYLFALIISIVLIYLITPWFRWDLLPDFIGLLQHPFRLLLIVTILLSILAAVNIYLLFDKKLEIKKIFIISLICLLYVGPSITDTVRIKDNHYESVYYKLDQMNIDQKYSPTSAGYEYLPLNADKNRNYIATRENTILALEGQIDNLKQSKISGNLEASFNITEEKTVLELPYIFYPGYEVLLNNKKINYFETENGFVGIELDEIKDYELNVKYTGTTLTKISTYTSMLAFIGFIVFIIINKKQKKIEF